MDPPEMKRNLYLLFRGILLKYKMLRICYNSDKEVVKSVRRIDWSCFYEIYQQTL